MQRRTKRAKGCLSRDGMLHMMFKLGQCAEKRWIKLRGFDYLVKIVTGVSFKDGIEVKDEDQKAALFLTHTPDLSIAHGRDLYCRISSYLQTMATIYSPLLAIQMTLAGGWDLGEELPELY